MLETIINTTNLKVTSVIHQEDHMAFFRIHKHQAWHQR